MQSEICIHLNRPDDATNVRRGDSLGGAAHWIVIQCQDGRHTSELSIFGTPEQLDAFIDSVTALRSQPDARTQKLIEALRKALGMPEEATELEVLLRASIADLAPAPTQTHSLTEVTS
jgi:hypothetical protein